MKSRLVIWLTIIFMLGFLASVTGQPASQRQVLLQLSETLGRESAERKAEALSIARDRGFPVRLELGNGRVAELMSFDRGMPRYYITHNAEGASVIHADKLYPGQAAGLQLTGAGQTLGIWDSGKVRNTHQEFSGRVTQRDDATSNSSHATHVAGTMMAAGTDPAARGMAYQANLDAWDWNSDVSEMAAAAAGGLRVSQHSYGYITGWAYGSWSGNPGWHWFGDVSVSQAEDYYFGFYSQYARAWDEVAWNAPNYLIVKSAGNDRGKGPEPGTSHYAWINEKWTLNTTVRDKNGGAYGYDCLSHSSLSKNVISVGAVTSTGAMTSFSSWGPTDDGRIKPDIVAKGTSVYSSIADSNSSYGTWGGTSMSGPMVSGSVGLLLHHQENLYPGQALLSSTIKALILHSADDMVSGAPGPDYCFGWGMMNTRKAAEIMSQNTTHSGIHIYEMTLTAGEEITITVRANGNEPLRGTIVWTDVPGTPPPPSLNPTTPALVNDLDMRLTDASSNIFLPYILDPANPSLPATTGDNFRDNVEMIHLAGPGINELYQLTISHKGSLSGGSQTFSLIITGNQEVSGILNPQSFVATADSPSQIELSWTKNDDGHNVMVIWSTNTIFGSPQNGTSYQAGQSIPGGGTVLYRGSNNSFEHTGLIPDVTYHYKAFSYDSENIYSAGLLASATIPCSSITAYPYLEDFNASESIPPCWQVIDHQDNGQVWQFGTHSGGLSGTTGYYAYIDSDAYGNGNSQNTDLVSPLFDLTAYTDVHLSFKHYFRQYQSSSTAALSYSTDDGATWHQIQQWTSTTVNPASFSQVIPQLAGQSQVRFKWNYTGSWGYWWDVDDVSVTATFYEPPPVYTFTYLAGDNGSIDGAASQSVEHGNDGTPVEAIPDNGYAFLEWNDGRTDNPRTDTQATEDITVTALYSTIETLAEHLSLHGITLDPGEAVCYSAQKTITLAGDEGDFIASATSQLTLIAGVSIRMLPGTHFLAGSSVHAYIAPGGPFCGEPDKQMVAVEDEAENEVEAERSEVPSDSEGSPDKVKVKVEVEKNEFFSVYPNPTPGRFTLELLNADEDGIMLIEVYGIRGERVLRRELPADLHQHELSLEGQLPGIYIIRVVSGREAAVGRIIKR